MATKLVTESTKYVARGLFFLGSCFLSPICITALNILVNFDELPELDIRLFFKIVLGLIGIQIIQAGYKELEKEEELNAKQRI